MAFKREAQRNYTIALAGHFVAETCLPGAMGAGAFPGVPTPGANAACFPWVWLPWPWRATTAATVCGAMKSTASSSCTLFWTTGESRTSSSFRPRLHLQEAGSGMRMSWTNSHMLSLTEASTCPAHVPYQRLPLHFRQSLLTRASWLPANFSRMRRSRSGSSLISGPLAAPGNVWATACWVCAGACRAPIEEASRSPPCTGDVGLDTP